MTTLGLIVGKTYLEVHPDASFAFFDCASIVGGVWSKDRLYPGLKTNYLWSAYEFSDFPLTGFGLQEGDHIPGSVVYDYLDTFAKHYGLARRVQFNTFVKNAEFRGSSGSMLQLIHTSKVSPKCTPKSW